MSANTRRGRKRAQLSDLDAKARRAVEQSLRARSAIEAATSKADQAVAKALEAGAPPTVLARAHNVDIKTIHNWASRADKAGADS